MAIIHKPFKYVPALYTDISKTIRREQLRLQALEEAKRKSATEAAGKVTPLAKSKAHQSP
jgi:hypothetical protein